MKSFRASLLMCASGLLLNPLSVAWASDIPPSGSQALSEILKSVELQKIGAFSEAEFDDGLWELKVCNIAACQKLYIDPVTGMEKHRRNTDADDLPPAGAMPLSTIVHSVEARGLGVITDVDFDDGVWEFDLRKDGRKTRLNIDPLTGETRR